MVTLTATGAATKVEVGVVTEVTTITATMTTVVTTTEETVTIIATTENASIETMMETTMVMISMKAEERDLRETTATIEDTITITTIMTKIKKWIE